MHMIRRSVVSLPRHWRDEIRRVLLSEAMQVEIRVMPILAAQRRRVALISHPGNRL